MNGEDRFTRRWLAVWTIVILLLYALEIAALSNVVHWPHQERVSADGTPVRLVAGGTDWPAWITAGATVVTTFIVAASALFAWRQLKDARITRHGELMLTMSQRWDLGYYESAAIFALYSNQRIEWLIDDMFGSGVPTRASVDRWLMLVKLPSLIEELADFRRYGAISIEAIDVIWGDRIISAWRQWEPLADHLTWVLKQRQVANPNAFADFRALAGELEERRASRP